MNPYDEATMNEPEEARRKLPIGTILRRLAISAIAWSTHAAVVAMLLLVFIDVGGMVRQEIDEYELGTPQVSEPLLSLCDAISQYWYLPIVALVVLDGPIAVVVCYLPRKHQWMAWVWYAGFLLVAIALLTWACVGLVSPLIFTMGPLMQDPNASINIHPSMR